ncbi:MAG: SusC/RagA family TonB-linked outer membrane protein, partial [Paramuribaculum sp.]|nr:SusC/RagA family TonB-linked outer membrane protein [Paramuribaculum sp.]
TFTPNTLAASQIGGGISAVASAPQSGVCTGTVYDEDGEPLPGASVFVEGSKNGASTNIDGKFSISNVKVGATVRISYVGYNPVSVVWDGKPISVNMTPTNDALDEVVVVGFGTQKRVDLTGAVDQVKMSEVLGDRPVVNAAAALQGAIPGLMVSGASSPGQSKSLNIRGDLSINGGSPLVLIDNVEGDIAQLNPDDIETVTVLKDAASSAIYGARAAGGVVLITTKKPNKDARISVTYNFNQAWERSINRPQQASLLEYISAYREAGYSNLYWAGEGNLDTWEELIGQYRAGSLEGVLDNGIYKNPEDGRIYYLKESDVQGSILGTGAMTNHNITMSGGTDRIRFRMSANYNRNNGPLVTDKDLFTRKAISSFVSADITKWLTQEVSMFYTNRQSNSLSSGIRDPYATRLISWYPVNGYMPADYLANCSEDLIIDSPYNSLQVTPTASNTYSVPRIQTKTIITPLKDWTITAEYTYNQTNQDYKWYTGVIRFADVQLAQKTFPTDATKNNYAINKYVTKYNALNLYTNYKLDLGKNHFTAMFGFNQESYNYAEMKGNVQGQAVITVPSFEGGTGEKTLSDSYTEYTIRGGFGRITYNFDERYLVNVSARYDGSSKFPKKNRYGFFPSISGAWRISQESFMEGARSWLTELKPRVSYGSIGNQNISPYGYVAGMSIDPSTVWLNDGQKVTVISMPGLVRANYTWETVKTLDFGIDFSVLNNRLTGTFDYYKRYTFGMLAAGLEIPGTIGAAAPTQNVANMRTDGWESSIRWQDRIGDWSYRISANVYDHLSKITKFNNATGSLSAWAPGRKINEIWGYVSDGFYSIDDFDHDKAVAGTWVLKEGVTSVQGVQVRPGDVKFKDLDGDNIITTGASTLDDPGDRKIIGNSTSRYQFGANAGVSWKGIDFDIMLQGVG